MIMFFLPWWTYVLIGTVVFACSFGAVWLANIAQPGVEQPGDGPFPCGAHLGTDEDGAEDWCWQLAGHDGDHLGMRQDWPEDLAVSRVTSVDCEGFPRYESDSAQLPDLPQRLSKVPEQGTAIQGSGYTPAQLLGQTEHNDPWPTCHGTSTEGACRLAKAHPGPHEYV